MPLTKTDLTLQYTSDFGFTESRSFKIAAKAPIPEGIYNQEQDNDVIVCSGSSIYRMRYITAQFINGTFQYPVPLNDGPAGVLAIGLKLARLGAVCLTLTGEYWKNVTAKAADVNYGTATYGLKLNYSPIKELFTYAYDSTATNKVEQNRFSVFLDNDQLALNQKLCLINVQPSEANALCSIAGLGISPRHFTGKSYAFAEGQEGQLTNSVARMSPVSSENPVELQTCAAELSPRYNCMTYNGESVSKLENFISGTGENPELPNG